MSEADTTSVVEKSPYEVHNGLIDVIQHLLNVTPVDVQDRPVLQAKLTDARVVDPGSAELGNDTVDGGAGENT